jgi:hypothetical protein
MTGDDTVSAWRQRPFQISLYSCAEFSSPAQIMIGLSQLLLAFATPEKVVGPVASSHSQQEQAVALNLYRPAEQATACSSCGRLEATGPTICSRVANARRSCNRLIKDLCWTVHPKEIEYDTQVVRHMSWA